MACRVLHGVFEGLLPGAFDIGQTEPGESRSTGVVTAGVGVVRGLSGLGPEGDSGVFACIENLDQRFHDLFVSQLVDAIDADRERLGDVERTVGRGDGGHAPLHRLLSGGIHG